MCNLYLIALVDNLAIAIAVIHHKILRQILKTVKTPTTMRVIPNALFTT
jgi:hypothetical protein